jgi:hypothetical protein
MTRSDADSEIRGLLQQIETAIAAGHMVNPSSGSAVEMLFTALSLLPLGSPESAKLMADFPLLLKYRAETEGASQHQEAAVDFLVFGKENGLSGLIIPKFDFLIYARPPDA